MTRKKNFILVLRFESISIKIGHPVIVNHWAVNSRSAAGMHGWLRANPGKPEAFTHSLLVCKIGIMKGRSFATIFFAIIVLLPVTGPVYSKTNAGQQKAPAKQRRVKRTSPAVAGQKYLIRPGDNLARIARRFGISQEAIKSANNLTGSRLQAGRRLTIPISKSAAIKKEEPPVVQKLPDPNETYISASTQSSDAYQGAADEFSSMRMRLVQAGFQLIGIRYRFGGSGQSGIDCSGLVKNLFSKFNIDLPRSSREQFKQGEKVNKDELQPGDLVFFSSGGNQPTHVGVYLGNNQLLHAARKARQVVVGDITKLWNNMRYLGARRVIDLWSDDTAPESDKN
jgi:cell wall-associated NlpC family hydrolase